MVQCMNDDFLGNKPGPIVHDGAPYCEMGLTEFTSHARLIMPNWSNEFDPLPEAVSNRPWWQYGKGSHASKP